MTLRKPFLKILLVSFPKSGRNLFLDLVCCIFRLDRGNKREDPMLGLNDPGVSVAVGMHWPKIDVLTKPRKRDEFLIYLERDSWDTVASLYDYYRLTERFQLLYRLSYRNVVMDFAWKLIFLIWYLLKIYIHRRKYKKFCDVILRYEDIYLEKHDWLSAFGETISVVDFDLCRIAVDKSKTGSAFIQKGYPGRWTSVFSYPFFKWLKLKHG